MAMAPHSSTLAWKIPWTEEPGGLQSMGLLRVRHDFTFTFHFHALAKEMATHSSVLAWRIPGTGETGGLPSVGSLRVRHDWSDLAAAAAAAVVCHSTLYMIKLMGSAFPPFFSLSGFSFAAMPFAHPFILNFSEVFSFRRVCCEQHITSYTGEVGCSTVWNTISCVYMVLVVSYIFLIYI